MKATVISALSALCVGLVAAAPRHAPLHKREYSYTTTTEVVYEDVTAIVYVDAATASAHANSHSHSWSWSHAAATTTPHSTTAVSQSTSETPVQTPAQEAEQKYEYNYEHEQQQEQAYQPEESAPEASTTPAATQAPTTTEQAYVPSSEPTKEAEQVKTEAQTQQQEYVAEPEPEYKAPQSINDGHKGEVTFYDAGLGACGWTNDGSTENVVALAHGYMGDQSNGNPHCGKMMEVTCNGKSVMAKVVDKCMGCVSSMFSVHSTYANSCLSLEWISIYRVAPLARLQTLTPADSKTAARGSLCRLVLACLIILPITCLSISTGQGGKPDGKLLSAYVVQKVNDRRL